MRGYLKSLSWAVLCGLAFSSSAIHAQDAATPPKDAPAKPAEKPAKQADDAVAGRWGLVVYILGEDEFVVFDVTETANRPKVEIVGALPLLGEAKTGQAQRTKTGMDVEIGEAESKLTFTGHRVKEGPRAGQFVGTAYFRDRTYPAVVRPTESKTVGEMSRSPLISKLIETVRETDPKRKVEHLEGLIPEFGEHPMSYQLFGMLFQAAVEAETPAAKVAEWRCVWLRSAEPFGPKWTFETTLSALEPLSAKAEYAPLVLVEAQAAETTMPGDASNSQRAKLLAILVNAARQGNQPELAAKTQARLNELEEKLDAEYLASVPPFKPTPYAGRKDPTDDRVAMVELFTGVQCPPCVAADVAFDALLKSYPSTELTALQYHLHVPGPDPLTNPFSMARARYYGVRGTPTLFLNGMAAAPGGGGMSRAESKYDQYREAVDQQLSGRKRAEIKLEVRRMGDRLVLTARAESTEAAGLETPPADPSQAEPKPSPKPAASKPAEPSDDDAEDEAESDEPLAVRLHVALTEHTVRYVGRNGVRFHHHVVRALPGGAGAPLVSGKASLSAELDLASLRRDLTSYLTGYGRISGELPPIPLTRLSLVAWVQNDSDKSIWHSVVIEVPEEK